MPAPLDGHNKHSLYMRGQPLGVECAGCGRRSTVFTKDQVETFKGDMTLLTKLKLVCSKCGVRDWRGWLMTNDAETQAWLERPLGGPAF